MNKSVISLIAILVLLVSISGCISDNQTTNNTSNQTVQQNTSQNYNVKISSTEAKNIAQKSIEQPGATAGEPMLKNDGGQQVYIVPIMQNNNIVGEIIIDAQTGENQGGAGGAPTK